MRWASATAAAAAIIPAATRAAAQALRTQRQGQWQARTLGPPAALTLWQSWSATPVTLGLCMLIPAPVQQRQELAAALAALWQPARRPLAQSQRLRQACPIAAAAACHRRPWLQSQVRRRRRKVQPPELAVPAAAPATLKALASTAALPLLRALLVRHPQCASGRRWPCAFRQQILLWPRSRSRPWPSRANRPRCKRKGKGRGTRSHGAAASKARAPQLEARPTQRPHRRRKWGRRRCRCKPRALHCALRRQVP